MLGDKIKKAREMNNISQIKLGEMLNVTQQAVGRWEKNKSDPDISTLKKISKLLNVSLSFLLEEEANNFKLTQHEKELIKAYRENISMQKSVDKLLEIEEKESPIVAIAPNATPIK